uniref:Putative secreted protein n=1 Tax=Ixodes ricinus TaxID=34613 RepID=A0A6B0UEH5_IXORI
MARGWRSSMSLSSSSALASPSMSWKSSMLLCFTRLCRLKGRFVLRSCWASMRSAAEVGGEEARMVRATSTVSSGAGGSSWAAR